MERNGVSIVASHLVSHQDGFGKCACSVNKSFIDGKGSIEYFTAKYRVIIFEFGKCIPALPYLVDELFG